MVFSRGNTRSLECWTQTVGHSPSPMPGTVPETNALPPALSSHLLPDPRAGAQAQSRGESPAPPEDTVPQSADSQPSTAHELGRTASLPLGPPSRGAARSPAWGCLTGDRLRGQEGKEDTAVPSRMPRSRHREKQASTCPLQAWAHHSTARGTQGGCPLPPGRPHPSSLGWRHEDR